MFKTKLPSSRLSLTYEFELPAAVHNPSSAVHDAAVKKAAALSGLVDPLVVSAKAFSKKDPTLASVHALPFDPKEFVNDGEKGVHFEFFYDPSAKRLAVRLVTTLGGGDPSRFIDGVVASRLAFMAIELLEGRAALSQDSPAAREPPPMKFGLRQQMNFARAVMPGTLCRIVFAWMSMLVDRALGIKPPADRTLVHDAKSLFRYYESSPADIAEYMVFRPTLDAQEKPFRKFLRVVDAWRCASSRAGYFYLINFSPLVAPGERNRDPSRTTTLVCDHAGLVISEFSQESRATSTMSATWFVVLLGSRFL